MSEFTEERNEQKKSKKKLFAIIIASVLCAVLIILISINYIIPSINYKRGMEEYNNKQYETAIEYLQKANNYKDADSKIRECNYFIGNALFEDKDYNNASKYYKLAIPYEDSSVRYSYCSGMVSYKNKAYEKAYKSFEESKGYKDSNKRCKQSKLLCANEKFKNKQYESALSILVSLPRDYVYNGKSVTELLNASNFMVAEDLFKNDDLKSAKTAYKKLPAGYSYKGVSVSTRMQSISTYEQWQKLGGSYGLKSGYISIKPKGSNITPWTHYDLEGGLDISVSINSNKKVELEVSVHVDKQRLSDLEQKNNNVSCNKTYYATVSSLSNYIGLNGGATLTISGSKVTLSDSYTQTNYDDKYTYQNSLVFSKH